MYILASMTHSYLYACSLVSSCVLCKFSQPLLPLQSACYEAFTNTMPKAEGSSRSSSPTKGSPSKRSHRAGLPSLIGIPYGTAASKVKQPTAWAPRHTEEATNRKAPLFVSSIPVGKLPDGVFFSDDVFRAPRDGASSSKLQADEEPSSADQSTLDMDEDLDSYDFESLKEALDDAALSSGLVSVTYN